MTQMQTWVQVQVLQEKLRAEDGKYFSWDDMLCSDPVLNTGIAVPCLLRYGKETSQRNNTY